MPKTLDIKKWRKTDTLVLPSNNSFVKKNGIKKLKNQFLYFKVSHKIEKNGRRTTRPVKTGLGDIIGVMPMGSVSNKLEKTKEKWHIKMSYRRNVWASPSIPKAWRHCHHHFVKRRQFYLLSLGTKGTLHPPSVLSVCLLVHSTHPPK